MNASSPSTNKTLAVERNQRVSHRQLATAYNCRLAAEGVIGGEHSTFGVRGQAQRDTALDPPVGGESKAPSTLRSAGALLCECQASIFIRGFFLLLMTVLFFFNLRD